MKTGMTERVLAVSNRRGLRSAVLSLVIGFGLVSGAIAQSTTWDSLLSNSQWYVPGDNLLAYLTSGTSLAQVTPAADQTLWSLGTATNGVFTGTTQAQLKIGPVVSDSTMTMNGVVTDSGQIRIVFTSTTATTVGIGQMRDLSGTTYMEMQMLTGEGGSSGSYVTHWAYMAPYDGNPGTLPPLDIPTGPIAQEWVWMEGTTWALDSPDLFGPGGSGTFTVDTYNNGYYWGSGTGTTGAFTMIGSATPEGNILFNTLNGNVLTSLTGEITGDATNGVMALRIYNSDGNLGDGATANVVPEPGVVGLLLAATGASIAFSRRRPAISI
ncbi:hypothetical protein BH09VER1_BH09VER1_23220 [soil metagenome]